MTFSFENISDLLERQIAGELTSCDQTSAAVAMIFKEGVEELELLFIQRSTVASDPWSGNLAFPGGRLQPDEDVRSAAERETIEEIGLDLGNARYLGRLADVSGSTLPVRVSCFVYGVSNPVAGLKLNHEVHDTFWVGLDELATPERHITSTVSFRGQTFEVPAIYIPRPDTPVLWGLTYRLVMQFMELLRTNA